MTARSAFLTYSPLRKWRSHYSAADIGNLIEASEKASDLTSRKSPALSIVRSAGAAQVPETVGGKGGTRTLDPGIMSAVL